MDEGNSKTINHPVAERAVAELIKATFKAYGRFTTEHHLRQIVCGFVSTAIDEAISEAAIEKQRELDAVVFALEMATGTFLSIGVQLEALGVPKDARLKLRPLLRAAAHKAEAALAPHMPKTTVEETTNVEGR